MPFEAVLTATTAQDRSVGPCPTYRGRCAFGAVGVKQRPRSGGQQLRLESDSSCRDVQRSLCLPDPSGGATTGHMDFCRFSRAGPSDSHLAGRQPKDGIPLRKERTMSSTSHRKHPPMKNNPTAASGRQRCMGCGHPLSEHLGRAECTVPQCACLSYQQPKQR